jgi:hypothetical protein
VALARCVVLITLMPGRVLRVVANCWHALKPYAMIDSQVGLPRNTWENYAAHRQRLFV